MAQYDTVRKACSGCIAVGAEWSVLSRERKRDKEPSRPSQKARQIDSNRSLGETEPQERQGRKINRQEDRGGRWYKSVSTIDTTKRTKQPGQNRGTDGEEKKPRQCEMCGNQRRTISSQSSVAIILAADKSKLRDHTGSLGPHEVFAGLLGQSASLGLLVVQTLGRLVGLLIVILHDPGWNLAGPVLLA